MGAVTFTKTPNTSAGILDNKRIVKGTMVFSASYAAGGDTLDLKTVGLTSLDMVLRNATGILSDISGLGVTLSVTGPSPKLAAWDTNAAEVSAATDLSARAAIPVWLVGT